LEIDDRTVELFRVGYQAQFILYATYVLVEPYGIPVSLLW
jgi:hypothetical protein